MKNKTKITMVVIIFLSCILSNIVVLGDKETYRIVGKYEDCWEEGGNFHDQTDNLFAGRWPQKNDAADMGFIFQNVGVGKNATIHDATLQVYGQLVGGSFPRVTVDLSLAIYGIGETCPTHFDDLFNKPSTLDNTENVTFINSSLNGMVLLKDWLSYNVTTQTQEMVNNWLDPDSGDDNLGFLIREHDSDLPKSFPPYMNITAFDGDQSLRAKLVINWSNWTNPPVDPVFIFGSMDGDTDNIYNEVPANNSNITQTGDIKTMVTIDYTGFDFTQSKHENSTMPNWTYQDGQLIKQQHSIGQTIKIGCTGPNETFLPTRLNFSLYTTTNFSIPSYSGSAIDFFIGLANDSGLPYHPNGHQDSPSKYYEGTYHLIELPTPNETHTYYNCSVELMRKWQPGLKDYAPLLQNNTTYCIFWEPRLSHFDEIMPTVQIYSFTHWDLHFPNYDNQYGCGSAFYNDIVLNESSGRYEELWYYDTIYGGPYGDVTNYDFFFELWGETNNSYDEIFINFSYLPNHPLEDGQIYYGNFTYGVNGTYAGNYSNFSTTDPNWWRVEVQSVPDGISDSETYVFSISPAADVGSEVSMPERITKSWVLSGGMFLFVFYMVFWSVRKKKDKDRPE